MKNINFVLSLGIFILNIYYLPFTFKILLTSGGAMGFGLLVLPVSLFVNFGLLTAIIAFKPRFKKSRTILIVNLFVILFAFFF